MSRMFYPCCVGTFALISLIVSFINLAYGCYLFGVYITTNNMISLLCSSKEGIQSISNVRDYQRVVYDYYVLSNLYVDLYMCSSTCPCIPYSQLNVG